MTKAEKQQPKQAEEPPKHQPERNILNPRTWTRSDWISLAILVIVTFSFSYWLNFWPRGSCEVATAAYKCVPAQEVIIEHCNYWGNWSCDSSKDVSLPQVEWYISNLCQIHNKLHDNKFDCNNLRLTCNQATGKKVCP